MPENWTHIRGFKPFISLWYDATEQILQEYDISRLNNDIKLFEILRAIVLSPEKPVFVRSYKLTDFNRIPDVQKHLNKTPNKPVARLTYVPPHQPSFYGRRPMFRVAPNTPSPISYLGVRNTKMFAVSERTVIRNNCAFKQDGLFNQPAHKIYTVMDNNDFIANVDDMYVLYAVSETIMEMMAKNGRKNINLQTFQDLTAKMYARLQEQQQKKAK